MRDSFRQDAFLVAALVFGLLLGVAAIVSITSPAPPPPEPAEKPRPTAPTVVASGPRIHSAPGEPESVATSVRPREPRKSGVTTPAPAELPPVPGKEKDGSGVALGDGPIASGRANGANSEGTAEGAGAVTTTPRIEAEKQIAEPEPPALMLVTTVPGVTRPSAEPAAPKPEEHAALRGSGATFPAPLYQHWIADYAKVRDGTKVDYQAIGSGGGLKAIREAKADFAASDAPMTKTEIEEMGGADAIVEFPTCAGGLVAAYDVPGVDKPLRLTGEILAEVFIGEISNWNDPRIAAVNDGVRLPFLAITPAWRTDGCRATFVWTRWLGDHSNRFETSIGHGKEVKWPVGHGGKGNPGVAAIVHGTPGAIGYLEQAFADAAKIPYALLKNTSGRFIACTPESVSGAGTAAAEKMSASILAEDLSDENGEADYPVSSFTYLIVRRDLRTCATKADAQALVDFLWWTIHDGQKSAAALDYAPLAPAVVTKVETALRSLTFRGDPLVVAR